MGKSLILSSGNNSIDPDELTATPDKVLKNYTFGGSGNDELQVGELEVQSIINFKVALYATKACIGTWALPSKGPWSGIRVQMKTGSYPTSPTDGTNVYEGSGTSFIKTGLIAGTIYYFSAFNYVMTNLGRLYRSDNPQVFYTATELKGSKVITGSSSWTVPANIYSIDLFCVGAGGPGYYGIDTSGGYGGGSGYVATKKNIAVTPGQVFTVNIGASMSPNSVSDLRSGSTIIIRNGVTILSALGGSKGTGGSGGGGGGDFYGTNLYDGGNGGYNGGNGYDSFFGAGYGGSGITTYAFGESNNTLYAGGGGGGSGYYARTSLKFSRPGNGGSGGGGRGNSGGGTNGTGSGGGGGCATCNSTLGFGGWGGSGVAIIRWGY